MLGFVETPRPRRPERPNHDFSPWSLFWMGSLLIFGFTSSMIPFGAYLPLAISIWALIFFFVPLVFLGMILYHKFGNLLLLAIFLSVMGGGIAILFLGDFFGYLFGINTLQNIKPKNVNSLTHIRYIFFKDFDLVAKEEGRFEAPLLMHSGGLRPNFGPVLEFHFVPIRDSKNPDTPLNLFALCFSEKGKHCKFDHEARGGMVLQEPLWDRNSAVGAPTKATFVVWRSDLPSSLLTKGFWSFVSLVLIHGVWTFTVFFPKWEDQPENPNHLI